MSLINNLAASIGSTELVIYVTTLSLNCILVGLFAVLESCQFVYLPVNVHSSMDVLFEISYCIQNLIYRTESYNDTSEIILNFVPYVLLLNRGKSLLSSTLLLQCIRYRLYNYNETVISLKEISDNMVIDAIRSQYKVNDIDSSDSGKWSSKTKRSVRKTLMRLSISDAGSNSNDLSIESSTETSINSRTFRFTKSLMILKVSFAVFVTFIGIGLTTFTLTRIKSQEDICITKYGTCLWNGIEPKILFSNGLFASSTCGESLVQSINGANCNLKDDIFENNDAPLYDPVMFKSVSLKCFEY